MAQKTPSGYKGRVLVSYCQMRSLHCTFVLHYTRTYWFSGQDQSAEYHLTVSFFLDRVTSQSYKKCHQTKSWVPHSFESWNRPLNPPPTHFRWQLHNLEMLPSMDLPGMWSSSNMPFHNIDPIYVCPLISLCFSILTKVCSWFWGLNAIWAWHKNP